MLDALKPFPAYKDSGVASLGAIPASWQVRRNGRLFAHRVETGFPSLPILEVSIKRGVRVRNFENAERKQVMADLAKYKRACEGDIAYNMMRMWQGAVGVSPVDGLVSPAYVVARPFADVDPHFYAHLFRTNKYMDEVNAFSRGIVSDRNRLYWADFKQMPSVFPPPAEQAGIVRFLGAVDRKVNRFIRAKRRLIEVLTEQKQAIITHAVTRGLNPDAPRKPSGIDWLGDVPKHWEVLPFLRCTVERADYRGATPQKVESGTYLVTAKNIRKGWIDYETSKEYVRTDQYEHIMRRGRPRGGDILFTTEAPLGHVALVDREDIALAQRIIRFRLDDKMLRPRFALAAMLSQYFQTQLEVRATGSTASGIKASKLPQLQIVIPPTVAEQDAIVEYVDSQTDGIGRAIADASREIDLIREYRTRLVADVVTGKLDVRAAASTLPDGPEVPEPLDQLEGAPPDEEQDAANDDADPSAEEVEV